MTKYSGETMTDEYEPEEGEIQDDEDVEDGEREKERPTCLKGKEGEECSKSFLLFPRDELKYCSRMSDCKIYGRKPYVTPDTLDGNRTSSRLEACGSNKWYPTHRQNNTSKGWSDWKSSGVSKERQTRETKRSRSQYYSSFFPSSSDSRSLPDSALPTNAYFNPSIPAWHWYSKKIKNKNKRTPSFANNKDTPKTMLGSKVSETNNFNSPTNSLSFKEKDTTIKIHNVPLNETDKHADTSPASPMSSDSIEVLEVPLKIPEVITLYDTDDEMKGANDNAQFSKSDLLVTNNKKHESDSIISQKSCSINTYNQENISIIYESDTIKKNTGVKNFQCHVNELEVEMKRVVEEKEEVNSKHIYTNCENESSGKSGLTELNESTENNINNSDICNIKSPSLPSESDNHDSDIHFIPVASEQHSSTSVTVAGVSVQECSSCSSGMKSNEPQNIKENDTSRNKLVDELATHIPTENLNMSEKTPSYEQLNNCLLENIECLHHERTDMTDCEKSSSERIYYYRSSNSSSETKFNDNCNQYSENVVYKIHRSDSIQNNNLNSLSSLALKVQEKNYNSSLTTFPSDIYDENRTNEEIGNIHINMENIIQIKCQDLLLTEKAGVIFRNTGTSPKDKSNTGSEIKTDLYNEVNDSISSETCYSDPCAKSFEQELSPIKNCLEHHCESKGKSKNLKVMGCSNNILNTLQKNSPCSDSVRSLESSTAPLLKESSSELSKLKKNDSEMNTTNKFQNQKLIPSAVLQKHLQDTSLSPSLVNSLCPLGNENTKSLENSILTTPCVSSTERTTENVVGTHLSYSSSVLIHGNKIGTKSNENINYSQQKSNRVNISVPEFIINLGKESDSEDESDDKSIQHQSDDKEEMLVEQKNDFPSVKTIGTEFEKKLDVLLKQARSRQESITKCDKGSVITNKELISSTNLSDSQINHSVNATPSATLHNNNNNLNGIEDFVGGTPRFATKKIVSPKFGKSKGFNSKIKNVIKNVTSAKLNCDKFINYDRTSTNSTSYPFNNIKQTNKRLNKYRTSRGRGSRQTISMGNIEFLSPLKQKEYLKLKNQLVQMTQKKKGNENEVGQQKIAVFVNKRDKPEDRNFKQIQVKNTEVENSIKGKELPCFSKDAKSQHNHINSVRNSATINKQNSPLTNSLTNTKSTSPSEIQIDREEHYQATLLMEHSPCNNNDPEQVMKVTDAKKNIILHDTASQKQAIPQTNKVHSATESSSSPHTICIEKNFFQQTTKCSNAPMEWVKKLNTNMCSTELAIWNRDNLLSGKRKNSVVELELKKQKIGKIEKCPIQNKVVQDLWSSETKLIAMRRQVLEDIATVRLHLHKIDAANFRTDQILKNIYRLKEELKLAEQQLTKEKESLKTWHDKIDDSKCSIQRGQSQLLSLSLECEELGCKVHGPNYNVPNTCVDLIRNEMLAMTQAMQELENQKNTL